MRLADDSRQEVVDREDLEPRFVCGFVFFRSRDRIEDDHLDAELRELALGRSIFVGRKDPVCGAHDHRCGSQIHEGIARRHDGVAGADEVVEEKDHLVSNAVTDVAEVLHLRALLAALADDAERHVRSEEVCQAFDTFRSADVCRADDDVREVAAEFLAEVIREETPSRKVLNRTGEETFFLFGMQAERDEVSHDWLAVNRLRDDLCRYRHATDATVLFILAILTHVGDERKHLLEAFGGR